jgi:hypothetical protein
MKMLTSVVAGIAVAAGSLGATVAFRTAADTPTSTTPPKAVAPAQPTRVPHVKRPTVLRFKPCPKGTERAGDHCVRHVVHTVVVGGGSASGGTPAAGVAPQAPPPPPAPVQQPAGSSGARASGSRPASHEGGDRGGEAEHEGGHADEPEQHEQEPSDD